MIAARQWWADPLIPPKEWRGSSMATPEQWIVDWFNGGTVDESGEFVTPESAMRSTTVLACVKINSGVLSSLPVKIIEKVDKERREIDDHPGRYLMAEDFNEFDAAIFGRAMMQLHQELRGRGLAYIERSGSGVPLNLYPLQSSKVEILRRNGKKLFRVNLDSGGTETLQDYEVLHVPAHSLDGLTGLSPIEQCMASVGLDIAARKYGARFFKQGAAPGGVVETESTKFEKPQRDAFIAEWNQRMQSSENSHLLAVLHSGLKYKPIGIEPEHAQFLETRRFGVTDITRLFGVPSFMVNDSEGVKSWAGSGVAQAWNVYRVVAIGFRVASWEAECNRKLLMPSERGRLRFKFNLDAMLRPETLERARAHQIGILTGYTSRQEARTIEDLPPGPPELEEFLTPQNMRIATDDPVGQPNPDEVVQGGGQ